MIGKCFGLILVISACRIARISGLDAICERIDFNDFSQRKIRECTGTAKEIFRLKSYADSAIFKPYRDNVFYYLSNDVLGVSCCETEESFYMHEYTEIRLIYQLVFRTLSTLTLRILDMDQMENGQAIVAQRWSSQQQTSTWSLFVGRVEREIRRAKLQIEVNMSSGAEVAIEYVTVFNSLVQEQFCKELDEFYTSTVAPPSTTTRLPTTTPRPTTTTTTRATTTTTTTMRPTTTTRATTTTEEPTTTTRRTTTTATTMRPTTSSTTTTTTAPTTTTTPRPTTTTEQPTTTTIEPTTRTTNRPTRTRTTTSIPTTTSSTIAVTTTTITTTATSDPTTTTPEPSTTTTALPTLSTSPITSSTPITSATEDVPNTLPTASPVRQSRSTAIWMALTGVFITLFLLTVASGLYIYCNSRLISRTIAKQFGNDPLPKNINQHANNHHPNPLDQTIHRKLQQQLKNRLRQQHSFEAEDTTSNNSSRRSVPRGFQQSKYPRGSNVNINRSAGPEDFRDDDISELKFQNRLNKL